MALRGRLITEQHRKGTSKVPSRSKRYRDLKRHQHLHEESTTSTVAATFINDNIVQIELDSLLC